MTGTNNGSAAPGKPAAGSDMPDPRALMDLFSPMALRVAATLRLADLIDAGSTEVTELAAKAGADADALGRLMRFLDARRVFTEVSPGRYELGPVGKLLRSDHPSRLCSYLDLDSANARIDMAVCGGLLATVRSGEPGYREVYGRGFRDDLAADPILSESFNGMMIAAARRLGPELADGYDWSGVKHVVDVGGGVGHVLGAIMVAHPHLTGTLVDLPATGPGGERHLAEVGVAERCTIVGQSFFDELPAGGDVYVLARVLHERDDDESTAILRRVAAAAGRTGKVLVAERVIADDDARAMSTEYDLRMAVIHDGGRERTADEYARVATPAGLTLRNVVRTPSFHSILEFSATD